MDLDYGPQYDVFREEVRQFLQTHGHRAPDGQGRAARPSPEAVEWQKLLILHGYTARTIPKEYGGLGLSQTNYSRAAMVLGGHCGNLTALLSAHQSIGVPQPLLVFGTPEQKEKYLQCF